MAKIGRNEQCPCRSGKKFKHCCALRRQIAVGGSAKPVTLMSAVVAVQEEARHCREMCLERGVFFLYSTTSGDAWLLEMTDGDCVQLAREGVVLTPEIIENSDTIEINYSHTYVVRGKELVCTAYENKEECILPDAPTAVLSAAMRRLRKKISKEQLANIHLPSSMPANNA